MKISKTHEKFSTFLRHNHGISNKEFLNHPETYLGPNWEVVINFWLYLDTLTEDKLKVVRGRYYALSNEEYDISKNKVGNSATYTTKYAYEASFSAFSSTSYVKNSARWTTLELISLDKLLEQGYQPVCFPLFLNL